MTSISPKTYELSAGDIYGPQQPQRKRHWFRRVPVPGTILMVQRAMAGEEIHKEWTPIENISEHLPRAVMGGEDSRFCEHKGLDVQAIKDALADNREGGLWNGGGYPRKAVEAWFSLFTNAVWGKRRTMEIYLNVAEWGDGIFGAEAAAQARFGKSAKDLNADEAAQLAAVLPSPNKWRLDPPSDFVNRRADTLIKRAEIIRTSQYDSCLDL